MELASDNKFPFVGLEVLGRGGGDADWRLVFVGGQRTPACFLATGAMSMKGAGDRCSRQCWVVRSAFRPPGSLSNLNVIISR